MTVRIDKWLWAARFFKTRAKAKNAIESGKIHVNRTRPKPSRNVVIGDFLSIRQGYDDLVVEVIDISERRGGAPEASKLYRETETSKLAREADSLKRKIAGNLVISKTRPSKKGRRMIHQFKDKKNSE
jgi:ribosome-associated heat shock protein Hsp15